MSVLRRNILANLLGGVWVACLFLLITPLQVNLLGVKAFGIIGLITTLQVILSVFDLGLSSTITRELAGDSSKKRYSSRPLLRTAVSFYWTLAVVVGVLLFAGAEGIGEVWFGSDESNVREVIPSLRIIAIVLALRWPVALYSGALAGMQRMDILNLIKVGSMTVRLVGGVLVLLGWKSLDAFLIWTALSAVIEVLSYSLVCRLNMSEMDWRPGFSLSALRAVWGFSLSMNGVAVLAVAISQFDRLAISKMLPLESLGYYSLAYSAAAAVSVVLSAFSSALMPSFAEAFSQNDRETLLQRYYMANKVLLFLAGGVLFVLLFFGEPILSLWVNPIAADRTWLTLALVAGGTWLSAAVSNAYNIAIGCRKPGIILKISAVSALIYLPTLLWMVSRWGIEGAASSWVLLNMGYLLVLVPIVHRRILLIPIMPWFFYTFFPFALLGTVVFGSGRLLARFVWPVIEFELLMIPPAIAVYAGVGFLLLGAEVRSEIVVSINRISKSRK